MEPTALPKPSRLQTDDASSWPSPTAPNNKRSFLTFLARAQRTSGLVFGSFLLVHAIPPTIVALTGSEQKGSGFMLLLRVSYQHPLIEPVLIYLPLTVHIVASLLRRRLYPRSFPPKPNSHSISGFLLTPLALLHILIHRIVPKSPKPPISSLSPAELDLSYVGHAVSKWPWVSTVTYGALVALGVWHAVGGLAIISRRSGWAKATVSTEPELEGQVEQVSKPVKKKSTMASWRTGLTVLATAITGVALYRLAQDVYVTKAMAGRIEYVHRRVASLVYR